MLGTSRVEEAPSDGVHGMNALSEYESMDEYIPNTLNDVTDITHLEIFSPSLLSQTVPDKQFMEMMLSLQKGYKFIDDQGNEKPIRGTRNSNVSSRINDLRAVLTGSKLVSKTTPTKAHAICASEVLKLIKDTLATTNVDFRRTFRAETATKLGYHVAKPTNNLDDTVTYEPNKTAAAPAAAPARQQKARTAPTETAATGAANNINTLQQWLKNQFDNQSTQLSDIKDEIHNLTEKTNATDAKLTTVAAQANSNETNIAQITEQLKIKERAKGQPALEMETKLKLKAYRARKQEDLDRGLLRITIRNTTKYAFIDEGAQTAYNMKPNLEAILRALNIDPDYCCTLVMRNGKAVRGQIKDDDVLPQIVIEANHGCLDKDNGTSSTTDHASYLIAGRRDRNDDFYINRAVNSTDVQATTFFGRWKQQGFLEKFIVNRYGMYTLYLADGEGHVNARNPLNLAILENPTADRIKQANSHGWTVSRGDPTKAFNTDI